MMNGDEKERLTKLETEMKFRWDAHDVRSDDRHKENREKFDKLFNWLEKLPCGERMGWYRSMGRQVAFMWLVLGGLLFISLRIWVVK